MMKNEIILFKHDKFGEIGVIFEDGNPLFPATECAKILGYKNPNDAIIRHCRYLVKHEVPHPQNANKTMEKTFVPEGDLYRLIMRSKLPEAVEFESWVLCAAAHKTHRLKCFHKVFTRYDKLDIIFIAFISFAMILGAVLM